MATKRPTVAVIGAGPAGLVALKNLIEEGFNSTGFDKNSSVGGLSQYYRRRQDLGAAHYGSEQLGTTGQ